MMPRALPGDNATPPLTCGVSVVGGRSTRPRRRRLPAPSGRRTTEGPRREVPRPPLAPTLGPVPRRIPLFPLGTVLFPGLVLPLHVFEPRYRTLVRAPDGRTPARPAAGLRRHRHPAGTRGRRGRCPGARSTSAAPPQIRRVDAYDDGRFDLVTVGSERFRLLRLVRPRVSPPSRPDAAGRVRAQDERAGEPATTPSRTCGATSRCCPNAAPTRSHPGPSVRSPSA